VSANSTSKNTYTPPAVLFMSLLSVYTYYQRRSNNGSGGGGSSRWKDGKATGKNIKGVGDLPKPPKGG
jgi:hypothetical protein